MNRQVEMRRYWGAAAFLGAAALALSGCGTDSPPQAEAQAQAQGAHPGAGTDRRPVDPPRGGKPAWSAVTLLAFYTEGGQSYVARVDPDSLEVLETAHTGFAGSGGKQKSWFYEGPVFVASGPQVWGIDPATLEHVERGQEAPFVQGNREGNVGPGLVNSAGLVGMAGQPLALSADEQAFLSRTSWTSEELQQFDLCQLTRIQAAKVKVLGGDLSAASHADPQSLLFHHMGYTPVGIESAPDGKLTMVGVRQGDHLLFLDTDPDSPDFGRPVRFVYPNYGFVKDSQNAVVANFDSVYQPAGGSAPGNLRWNRSGNATGGESDPQTYVEPCDSTMLRSAQGEVWTWTPDVDGDTLTGVDMARINTSDPAVHVIPVPKIKTTNFNNAETVGPWMASLLNRNAGDEELILMVEYEGENSQGVWNVSDAANAYEIQRIFTDLQDVVVPEGGAFVTGNTYGVTVDFGPTGGASQTVQYAYVALANDDGSGASSDHVTTGYLAKVDPADPGPSYLLNGLWGRASTSNGAISRKEGDGPEVVIYSDEVWLATGVGADGFQIVDLTTAAPFLVTETLDIPSASAGYFAPDGSKYFQVVGGQLQVIDRAQRRLLDPVALPGNAVGIAMGTYTLDRDSRRARP